MKHRRIAVQFASTEVLSVLEQRCSLQWLPLL
jgi:hypothetical protein